MQVQNLVEVHQKHYRYSAELLRLGTYAKGQVPALNLSCRQASRSLQVDDGEYLHVKH